VIREVKPLIAALQDLPKIALRNQWSRARSHKRPNKDEQLPEEVGHSAEGRNPESFIFIVISIGNGVALQVNISAGFSTSFIEAGPV